ncbi:hypothetical protein GCK66_13525 [Aeromonas hydrophila]|nr:hypothetical protein GCK66_13525 [Aeromonas hydrophila]UNU39469.1 hypothetical protein GET80_13585 [Aeromonas hydrophila]
MENNSRPIVDGAAILGGIAASDQWLPARSGSQTKFLRAVMVPVVVMVPERYRSPARRTLPHPSLFVVCLMSLAGRRGHFFPQVQREHADK